MPAVFQLFQVGLLGMYLGLNLANPLGVLATRTAFAQRAYPSLQIPYGVSQLIHLVMPWRERWLDFTHVRGDFVPLLLHVPLDLLFRVCQVDLTRLNAGWAHACASLLCKISFHPSNHQLELIPFFPLPRPNLLAKVSHL